MIIDDKTINLLAQGFSVSGVPYYEHSQDFQTQLEKRDAEIKRLSTAGKKAGFNILLIHQTPSGLGNPNIPVDIEATSPLFSEFDMVFCGHIHTRQEITAKFTIIGSPNHRDLGDEGQEKGFYVVDTETKTKEFVSTKGKYPEYKRQRIKVGQQIEGDGFNYIVPQFVEEAKDIKGETVIKDNFEIDLTPAKLMENYIQHVKPNDVELLQAGLECLTLKIED
jgi:DNA repair exonuclease SbcCD nuclease subunit